MKQTAPAQKREEGHPILGPYRLGGCVPALLQGWRGLDAEVADRTALADYWATKLPTPPTIAKPHTKRGARLPGQKGAEDCAVAVSHAIWAATRGLRDDDDYFFPNPAIIYALSRNQILPQLTEDGTTLARSLAAVITYGVVWQSAPSMVADYEKILLCRETELAACPYAELVAAAEKVPIVAVPLHQGKDVIDWLRRGGVAVIAGTWALKMVPVLREQRHWWVQDGRWQHATSLIGWDGEAAAVYRVSTWGFDAHGWPPDGCVQGGAWIEARKLKDEVDADSVVYGIAIGG